MNKTTNNYRKCAFCPHHGQQAKCCCRKQKKRISTQKRNSNTHNTLKNESAIKLVDQSQLKFNQINLPTLIAENSFLKSANRQLKNDLLSVSQFIKEQKYPFKQYTNVTTNNTLKTQSEQLLSDKLYISNKNLQQAILKIDSLSRFNKQILEKNIVIESQISSLKFQNEALIEQIDDLKKKLKKSQISLNESQINGSYKEEYKILKQKYQHLKIQNGDLLEGIDKLQGYLKSRKNKECMSPEWIAETSNKITLIEQKIDHVQQPQNLNSYTIQPVIHQKNHNYFEIIHNLKEQLALTINTIHTKTRKFISVFDSIGNVQNINIKTLICSLMQGFVQNCINLTFIVQNQMNRKILSVQKRMDYVLGKLQNFVLDIQNRQLRKRSTSRSKIIINYSNNMNKNNQSKATLHCKSPFINKIDNKENYNSINRNDKTC